MTENLPANLKNIRTLLGDNMDVIKSSIPKHMTPERMLRIAFTTIQHTPKLADCNPHSLVAAVVEASQLGLEIDGRGMAYLVPFGKTAQLVIGYKGKMELAYRSGKVKSIYAEIIYKNDIFKYSRGLNPTLEHLPAWDDDRGKMIGVYAVAELMTGGKPFVVLSRKDVEKIKKVSKTDAIWKAWEEEMWKKTAIHRLTKEIPSSPEMQRAVMLEDQIRANIPQTLAPGVTLLGMDDAIPATQTLADDIDKAANASQDKPEAQESAPEKDEPPEEGWLPDDAILEIYTQMKVTATKANEKIIKFMAADGLTSQGEIDGKLAELGVLEDVEKWEAFQAEIGI